jgi:transposase-like protein/predicted RNA-binding Zn-ribbon protein involved in translation (DUF1610 family)
MHTGPTIQQFFQTFPDDDACLDYLMKARHGEALDCPKCGKHGKFHRIRRHPAYECAWCGFEIFPMVGTPFHRSHVPLQKWFYAMYLFTTSRHGVPAKELQRQLGVSYPTAFRMAHKIREYMGFVDGNDRLKGHVEIDETMVGGYRPGPRGRAAKGKTTVFGMVERGGDLITHVVPDVKAKTLLPLVWANVRDHSKISADELPSYDKLRYRYKLGRVNHRADEWVNGIHHTNTIEGFWSQIKRSIRGTHIHVSAKHLPKYLAEFEYRHNLRKRPGEMFVRLLAALAT